MTKPNIHPNLRFIATFLLVLLFILSLIMFSGCKTIHTESKSTETKTVTIKQKDTVLIYKGGSVSNQSDLDSIFKYLTSQEAFKQRLNGIQKKVIYYDAQGKVAQTFWLDKYGKLQVSCTSKDSAYHATIQNMETFHEKEVQELKSRTVKERYVPGRFWVLVGIMLPFTIIGLFVAGRALKKIL